MKLPPFDAPNYGESNKLYFIFLWSLDSRKTPFKYIAKIQFFFDDFMNFDITKY